MKYWVVLAIIFIATRSVSQTFPQFVAADGFVISSDLGDGKLLVQSSNLSFICSRLDRKNLVEISNCKPVMDTETIQSLTVSRIIELTSNNGCRMSAADVNLAFQAEDLETSIIRSAIAKLVSDGLAYLEGSNMLPTIVLNSGECS